MLFIPMLKTLTLFLSLLIIKSSVAQHMLNDSSGFFITVINDQQETVQGITIELFNATNKGLVKSAISNFKGQAVFYNIGAGEHYFVMSGVGYQVQTSPVYKFPFAAGSGQNQTIQLTQEVANMQEVLM